MAGYASYYNNYIAAAAGYYPGHQAGYGAGYGTTGGTGSVPGSAHSASHSANGAPAPVYHLSTLPPPPSIIEPGTNSLEDVLKSGTGTRKSIS